MLFSNFGLTVNFTESLCVTYIIYIKNIYLASINMKFAKEKFGSTYRRNRKSQLVNYKIINNMIFGLHGVHYVDLIFI